MGAWEKGPPAALVVCPASRGRTEVQIPRDEKMEREVAKATVERIDLPVAHKMQRLYQGGNSGFQRVGLRKSSRGKRLVRVLMLLEKTELLQQVRAVHLGARPAVPPGFLGLRVSGL
jgi:hypothetical protein